MFGGRRSLAVACAGLVGCVAAVGSTWAAPASAQAGVRGLGWVEVSGDHFLVNGQPWTARGINWIKVPPPGSTAFDATELTYLDNPTQAGYEAVARGFRRIEELHLNSVRIYVELGQVLRGPGTVNQQALAALEKVLRLAAQAHIYLDITGDVVWRPWRFPWLNMLSPEQRWQAQVKFWQTVAHAAANSSAVFSYELTSEPQAMAQGPMYVGEFRTWWFDPNVTYGMHGNEYSLAREWVTEMKAAVRSQDKRHLITIGLFPATSGPFGPANVADLLDFLTVHVYPVSGQAAAAINIVRDYAAYDKPVVIGETWTLDDTLATQRQFLSGSQSYVSGVFQFFN